MACKADTLLKRSAPEVHRPASNLCSLSMIVIKDLGRTLAAPHKPECGAASMAAGWMWV